MTSTPSVCSRCGTPDASVVADVADVLARAGRPIIDVRDIDVSVADTPAGLPEARVDAGTTSVRVYQDQTSALVVAIAATTTDEAALVITLNRQQLHPSTSRPRGPADGGAPS